MQIAVYPGSFDPITNGHLDIIHRVSRLFEHVIVAVGRQEHKQQLFTFEERVELIKSLTAEIPNVETESFDGLLVHYVRRKGANVIIRGLRAISDFEYEFQLALANKRLDDNIETLFMMTSSEHSFLSSSIVKEVASHGGSVQDLVPPLVAARLAHKYQADTG
ncbi:MAG: pantetheine-phosphate adenylyltransferase [bacterium]